MTPVIHPIKLRVSNAYLVLGDSPILVDTGAPGEVEKIRLKLRSLGVEFSDLTLIAHTHVHYDHMGCTKEIATQADCPIAYHPADQPIVDRSSNGKLRGVGLRGKMISPLFSHAKFESVDASVSLHQEMSLAEYGVDVTVYESPGHTAGSVSLVTSTGEAMVGDALTGGFLGGAVLPGKPNYPYFADDLEQAMTSIGTILRLTSGMLYVGHGGPLRHARTENWYCRVMPRT